MNHPTTPGADAATSNTIKDAIWDAIHEYTRANEDVMSGMAVMGASKRFEKAREELEILIDRAALAAGAPAETPKQAEYTPGKWFDVRTLEEMQSFYMARLPAIRDAAKDHGYAVGLHGSTRRDFDLMAMQWRDGASDKDTLAHAIAVAACGITRDGAFQWEAKPNNRFAVSMPICWTDHANPDFDKPSMGHIDLSVITSQAATGAGNIEKDALALECIKSVSIGHTDFDHNNETVHCAECQANLDDGDEHFPDCLTERARTYLAAIKSLAPTPPTEG